MQTTLFEEKGRLFFDQHKFAKAIAEYKKVLQEDPNSDLAHRMISLCYSNLDNDKLALEHAQAALKIDPNAAPNLYVDAVAQRRANRLLDAENSIRAAIAINPESPRYFAELSFIQMCRDSNKEALKSSETGLSLDATNKDALCSRSWSLYYLSRTDEAQRSVDETLALYPEDYECFILKGWIAFKDFQTVEAIASFKEALRLNPNSPAARRGLLRTVRSRNPIFGIIYALLTLDLKLARRGNFITIVPAFLTILGLKLFAFILTSVIPHLLNFSLLLDRRTRSILTKQEIFGACLITIWLTVAFVLTIWLLKTNRDSLFFAPIFWLIYGTPFLYSRIFDFYSRTYRINIAIAACVALFVGISSVISGMLGNYNLGIVSTANLSFITNLLFVFLCFTISLLHAGNAIDQW